MVARLVVKLRTGKDWIATEESTRAVMAWDSAPVNTTATQPSALGTGPHHILPSMAVVAPVIRLRLGLERFVISPLAKSIGKESNVMGNPTNENGPLSSVTWTAHLNSKMRAKTVTPGANVMHSKDHVRGVGLAIAVDTGGQIRAMVALEQLVLRAKGTFASTPALTTKMLAPSASPVFRHGYRVGTTKCVSNGRMASMPS